MDVLNQLSALLNPSSFDGRALTPEKTIDKLGDKLREVVDLITVRIHDDTYKKQYAQF